MKEVPDETPWGVNPMSKFTDFLIKDGLNESCYLAIIPNDDGYDIEVEANEGIIAGNYTTGTKNLKVARKVADEIEKDLGGKGINVFKTRELWENFKGE